MKKTALLALTAVLLPVAFAAGKPCGNSYISANYTCHIDAPRFTPALATPPVVTSDQALTPAIGTPAPDVVYFPLDSLKTVGSVTQSGESYTLTVAGQTLTVTPGQNVAQAGGRALLLAAGPIVVQGRAYAPLRLLDHLRCTRRPRITERLATCDGKPLKSADLLSY